MEIIQGRAIRDKILSSLTERVARLSFSPVFCDVLVGEDSVSLQYVRMKEKTAESLGLKTHHAVFPESITTEELVKEVRKIASMEHMAGLIVQLPLPSHIDRKAVLDAVPSSIDVDALSEESSRLFYENNPSFIFPTAAACLCLIDSLNLDLSNKKFVVVGQGMLVGKPVTHLLKQRGYDVSVVDIDTKEPEEIIRNADVVISAVGKAGLIRDVKEGAIVIDAGTSESGGGVVGDVEKSLVEQKAGFLSPVPGGVGPVTVAMLMQNVVMSAERL